MASITEAMGTDLAHVGDLQVTAGGDLQTISGLANLKNALYHRLLTVPGTLVHRPLYGVGLKQFQNSCVSYGQQQKLASIIREQYMLDPRVEDVTSISITSPDGDSATTVIKIFVKPVGYSEIEMQLTPFSGA